MKAILVIDVPNDCGDISYNKATIKLQNEKLMTSFTVCNVPLKPMPEKLPEVSYDSKWWGWNKILDHIIEDQTKVKDFAKGWNNCIAEILGENE